MKNMLIISFLHSSSRHIGAIRTQRFARYLPQFGWTPFIITKPSLHHNSEEGAVRNGNTIYALSIPLNKPFRLEVFTWIPFMLAKALRVLRRYRINVVLISCPPFHQALAGILLKRWFGPKLVIDYRDAWSLNPYYQSLDSFHKLVIEGDKIMEERLLRNTDLLVVSHQAMKDNYLRKFHFLEGKIEVVYNGFDPETIKTDESTLFPEFTILHLGDFYAKQKTRDPGLFLSALQDMISEQNIPPTQLRVFFVGERYSEIEKAIASKGLSAYVSYIDRVPHNTAMEYLNKSHMLLLIETGDVMTTKVFEYLATGKPILALITNNELKALIERYSSNSYVITAPDLQTIKEDILHCYKNYYRNMTALLKEFRQTFSRRNQTAVLAEKLEKLLEVRQ
jgi:glycosyltransferase involved in cell wall biosynthesis